MLNRHQSRILHLLFAFAAGFISVLLFHQGMLIFLNQINFTQFPVYPTNPTQPFGIPAILSMAFWGGVWGIVLVIVTLSLRKQLSYWLTVLLFGALAPTAVFLFVVSPLKGMPVAGGWDFRLIATGLMLNGAWGLGTALLLQLAVNKVSRAKKR
ncbi:hypothetical protein HC931_11875 [Candidatus Gracilibacteria bacterium]|nr:hypothetical protein [Candidatus Gracilibacteria bacterium]NJM89745.1 hypothetical protein [Hydrococcus sp. RU_2_2]NJP19259.1 hypothetical protein [Hydrococcus sp. CRU_1_1]NJQ98344.1 hypothetical protein [Hydrococcus sp. CSU_1_8]